MRYLLAVLCIVCCGTSGAAAQASQHADVVAAESILRVHLAEFVDVWAHDPPAVRVRAATRLRPLVARDARDVALLLAHLSGRYKVAAAAASTSYFNLQLLWGEIVLTHGTWYSPIPYHRALTAFATATAAVPL